MYTPGTLGREFALSRSRCILDISLPFPVSKIDKIKNEKGNEAKKPSGQWIIVTLLELYRRTPTLLNYFSPKALSISAASPSTASPSSIPSAIKVMAVPLEMPRESTPSRLFALTRQSSFSIQIELLKELAFLREGLRCCKSLHHEKSYFLSLRFLNSYKVYQINNKKSIPFLNNKNNF